MEPDHPDAEQGAPPNHLEGCRTLRPAHADRRVRRDDASYEELYRANRKPMIALAHVLTHGSSDAEDIVQDSFINMRAKWHDIDNPVGYLRRSVVHACFHRGRDLQRREAKLVALHAPTAHTDSIDELWDVLPTLTDRQREAIVLYYYEDLQINEIAELTDQAPNTVKSHLDRARKTLRKALER